MKIAFVHESVNDGTIVSILHIEFIENAEQ